MNFIAYILSAIGLWKIFEKAKVTSWYAIVPIFNIYYLNKIANRPKSYFWWAMGPMMVSIAVVTVWGIIFYLENATGLSTGFSSFIPFFLIPFFLAMIVSLVFMVLILDGLSKAFGKSSWFTVGLVLLPFVFYLILGFDSSKFKKTDTKKVEKAD